MGLKTYGKEMPVDERVPHWWMDSETVKMFAALMLDPCTSSVAMRIAELVLQERVDDMNAIPLIKEAYGYLMRLKDTRYKRAMKVLRREVENAEAECNKM